ncbi:MAG TPA: hypothetical protein VFO60_02450, partial [Candidatus Dormibacteraeota bacterium]|nr:hypothetical protein [Candidatus Dormibacteraeota bacterium]
PVEPSVAVDITGTLETKIRALIEHRSQATEERLRASVPTRAADAGRAAGVEYAELYYRIALP